MLDLTEHWLDDLLAQSVAAAATGPLELGGHVGDPAAGPGSASLNRGRGAVPLAAGRDVALDAAPRHGAQIGLGAVAGIGRSLIGVFARVRLDGIEQRRQLRLVGRRVGQAMGYDDLPMAIDCGPGVVALD